MSLFKKATTCTHLPITTIILKNRKKAFKVDCMYHEILDNLLQNQTTVDDALIQLAKIEKEQSALDKEHKELMTKERDMIAKKFS